MVNPALKMGYDFAPFLKRVAKWMCWMFYLAQLSTKSIIRSWILKYWLRHIAHPYPNFPGGLGEKSEISPWLLTSVYVKYKTNSRSTSPLRKLGYISPPIKYLKMCWVVNNSTTQCLILLKSGLLMQCVFPNTSQWFKSTSCQIQDGGPHPNWSYLNRNSSSTAESKSLKFGMWV